MPARIREIFTHESDDGAVGVFGIDEESRLYWNGKRVQTESKVKLSAWVNVAVVLGGISTAVIAFFTVLMYLNSC